MNWQDRANKVIAQGCTTYSKRYDQFIEGVYPTHVDMSTGDHIRCENKYYIDTGSLGSGLIDSRNNYSLPSFDEVLLAEYIQETIPCIEKLKFLKTGSAACEMAVRYGRAHSNKAMVWFQGYHGTHDTFISHEIPGAGCVGGEYSEKFDTLDDMIKSLSEVTKEDLPGTIIIEPVILDNSEQHINNLRDLVRICKEKNIIVVFDEIVTGFRYLDYTVCNHYGLKPDLICLGKALGNGYPISVLGGRADIMDNPNVFCSNTHNGESCSLREAYSTIQSINEMDISTMWKMAESAMEEFNKLSSSVALIGIPPRWTWKGDELKIAMLWQEMLFKKWILGKSVFPKLSWTNDIYNKFIDDCMNCLKRIDAGEVKLLGKLPRPVFKRY